MSDDRIKRAARLIEERLEQGETMPFNERVESTETILTLIVHEIVSRYLSSTSWQ